jgi:hypothetical protein
LSENLLLAAAILGVLLIVAICGVRVVVHETGARPLENRGIRRLGPNNFAASRVARTFTITPDVATRPSKDGAQVG